MAGLTVLFGVFLIALGLGGYFATDRLHPTSLIPAYFGAALVLLGAVARNPKLRMHVMHVAVLIGLVGLAVPGFRVAQALVNGAPFGTALVLQAVMAGLCLVFVMLCVRSFIAARRQRQATGR